MRITITKDDFNAIKSILKSSDPDLCKRFEEAGEKSKSGYSDVYKIKEKLAEFENDVNLQKRYPNDYLTLKKELGAAEAKAKGTKDVKKAAMLTARIEKTEKNVYDLIHAFKYLTESLFKDEKLTLSKLSKYSKVSPFTIRSYFNWDAEEKGYELPRQKKINEMKDYFGK